MGFKSLTTRTIFTFALFDALLNPLVIASYFQMLGIAATQSATLVMAAMVILKVGASAIYIRNQLQAYEAFAVVHESGRTPELVLRADEGLQGVVTRLGVFYATTWALTYAGGFLILQSRLCQGLVFNSGAWMVVALLTCGLWLGGFASGTPLAAVLTASAAGECSTCADQLGITLPRVPESLQTRIGVVALALALAPTACSIALGYTKQIENQEQLNFAEAELLVTRLAEQFHPGLSAIEQRRLLRNLQGSAKGVDLALLDRRGRSVIPDADGGITTPSYAAQLVESVENGPRGTIRTSGRAERFAYQQLEDGVIAVAHVDLPSNTAGFVLSAVIFAIAIAFWAPVSAIVLARAITTPLDRLISATERIVAEGKQSEMVALPVARNDEVGRLSARFNDLLNMMRDLSRAADAIASGELRVEISRKGELPDAFRRMLESLRGMVREIRGTSVDLASAATEILAASQEQESAAASQSSAMEEINRTMDSLSASAAHVSDSVQGVLANAEQTLGTTDHMVARITELSGHANRIGEILDVIREIADRSDLLALNGSLEASRAGESGHGFALVATEMRRLAERVTASVEDVKRLVSDIRDSGSSTVAATEEGRRLANGTTEAARQITFVTQQQRSGTEQVSESIRNITDVVTQAVSATAQTRTSAQGLKGQADRLAALVKRFELEPGGAA
ncbi:MAG TPA: methyl-accepting chemotaxis protein [Polyangiaceae bacterium]